MIMYINRKKPAYATVHKVLYTDVDGYSRTFLWTTFGNRPISQGQLDKLEASIEDKWDGRPVLVIAIYSTAQSRVAINMATYFRLLSGLDTRTATAN